MKDAFFNKLLFSITLYNSLVVVVESRQREDIRPGRHDDVDRFDEVYYVVRNLFLLALAPAVFSFFYRVLTDPDLPFIIKNVKDKMTKKILGKLSD
mmetsp:Transcript_25362/g.31253  ORF Transcript_25362/g.31253 Transcript_25362/m.31253 type:complete len:96 (+) Transcript_25362:167-454(+)